MKHHSLLILMFFAFQSVCVAQQHPVKITFETPKGWGGETITLPPGFAKDMATKGIEEIRFAPGMFKVDQPDFFSYALVFWIPDQKPMDQKTIQAELLKYYKGLTAAVGRNRQPPIKTDSFKLDVKPVKEKKGQYTAVLHWIEPFRTGKPQTLYFELGTGAVPNMKASYLSMAVSPQTADHKIWNALRKVITSVKYKATKAESAKPTE